VAESIANHLGIFDDIISSDGVVNLSGSVKSKELVRRFGEKGFDYVGNSKPDLEVWKFSRNAIVVNASEELISSVKKLTNIEVIFSRDKMTFGIWAKALRLHQWLKNALLFVPLLAAHLLNDLFAWQSLAMAFVAFSLCASSVYIANDLFDLESDRHHPRKCSRPFASGALPIFGGVIVGPLLLMLSCLVGAFVGQYFLLMLFVYFLLTCVYSIKLKQLVLVDCMALAILYTLRIVAGAAAISVELSFWLLAFSIFLFLSLAFLKRFAELKVHLLNGKFKAHGRGYFTDDAPLVQMFGIASGFMSVLVLALYLNSPEVLRLYAHPEWVWGNVPVMIFWVSWLWLRANRGEMHDDPVIFAVKDKVSLLAGLSLAMFILLGAMRT
jgi:4-hydroxybenzoate polyprenyltransferase